MNTFSLNLGNTLYTWGEKELNLFVHFVVSRSVFQSRNLKILNRTAEAFLVFNLLFVAEW
jgi:hypothetical protein